MADMKINSHSFENQNSKIITLNHAADYSTFENRSSSIEPKSSLPNITSQGINIDNPYRITRTRPSLLNQNISF
jgi:hypothetical protein